MCSRPTGSSWQFGSSLGFDAVLCLLWAWLRHVEAGRGSVWPQRCTETTHILLAFHVSYKSTFLLWELNQGCCEVSPMQRQQKGWASFKGQYKAAWAVLNRKGRENTIPLSSFFFSLPSPLPMKNVSHLPEKCSQFLQLDIGFFWLPLWIPSGGIWQCPIMIWGSQWDLCVYLSI